MADAQSLQVTLSVGIPTLAVLASTLVNNSRLSDLRSYIDTRFTAMEHVMDARFAATDAKLLRVEGIVDARLSRIEQELKIR